MIVVSQKSGFRWRTRRLTIDRIEMGNFGDVAPVGQEVSEM